MLELKSIGVIHSSFSQDNLPPDQGILTAETATLEIFPEYRAGLTGLEECDKILVVYWMGDGSDRDTLWNERKNRGCFATRTPNRPNPIAVSLVDVISFSLPEISVRHLEAFDNSILLDLKPHSRKLDGGFKGPFPSN